MSIAEDNQNTFEQCGVIAINSWNEQEYMEGILKMNNSISIYVPKVQAKRKSKPRINYKEMRVKSMNRNTMKKKKMRRRQDKTP